MAQLKTKIRIVTVDQPINSTMKVDASKTLFFNDFHRWHNFYNTSRCHEEILKESVISSLCSPAGAMRNSGGVCD
jgi:hypothetical protein